MRVARRAMGIHARDPGWISKPTSIGCTHAAIMRDAFASVFALTRAPIAASIDGCHVLPLAVFAPAGVTPTSS